MENIKVKGKKEKYIVFLQPDLKESSFNPLRDKQINYLYVYFKKSRDYVDGRKVPLNRSEKEKVENTVYETALEYIVN
jgi:hypothetical protein